MALTSCEHMCQACISFCCLARECASQCGIYHVAAALLTTIVHKIYARYSFSPHCKNTKDSCILVLGSSVASCTHAAAMAVEVAL